MTEDVAGPEIPAPLDEPASKVIPCAKTLVLEYGVQLKRVGPDVWQCLAKGMSETGTLSDITNKLGLKVVKVTINGASREHHFLIPTTTDRLVLEMQAQNLEESNVRVDGIFAHHVSNLGYIARAVVYHCGQLVDRYSDVLEASERLRLSDFSEDFLLSRAVEPYFEFEALVTTVIRAYETARYPLWSAYGPRDKTPNSFGVVVKHQQLSVPKRLKSALRKAAGTYKRAKQYRACVQHNAHFGARLPFARIQLRQGLAWSVIALIPDNPGTKSYNQFDYNSQIDALSYGWQLTNRLLEDLAILVAALPPRRRHPRPRPCSGRMYRVTDP